MDLEVFKATVLDLENKLKQMQEILQLKNNELEKLENVISETQETLKNSHNLKDLNLQNFQNNQLNQNNPNDPYYNLLSSRHMDIIQEDETRMVAQTAHKTIKTLQDLLESKNAQIQKKDEIIEQLKNDLIKNKEIHLNQTANLQEQIYTDSQNTMNKLRSVIESVNSNLIVKISKNQLSTMTLSDIEKSFDEKDANIKLLAVELKSSKEQGEILQFKIFELNKRIGELSLELNEERLCKDSKTGQISEITKLRNIIREKSELIEEERERIKHLREEFGKRMDDKYHMEEQLFKCSVHVPERLVENNDKAIIYNKLQSVRNKNKKLIQEIDNLNKKIEENKDKYAEIDKKCERFNNENKAFLSMQAKDTKSISRLKKEKDELKELCERIKEENDNLKKLLDNNMINSNSSQSANAIHNNPNSNNNFPNIERERKGNLSSNISASTNFKNDLNKKRSESRSNLNTANAAKKDSIGINNNKSIKNNQDVNVNIDMWSKNKNGTKDDKAKSDKILSTNNINNSININNISNSAVVNNDKKTVMNYETPEELMNKLIGVCLKKRINMMQHLQRYDFSKSGELTKKELCNAIDEIRAGILSSEVNKILQHFDIGDEHINIKKFIASMVLTEPLYADIVFPRDEGIFIFIFIIFFNFILK